MEKGSIVNLHNGRFCDDDLYIAFELLNFLAFFSKKNPVFSIERTPKYYLEKDLRSRLEFLLEHVFGIEFELLDAEFLEYKLFPIDESVEIVSGYIDNQVYNFSLSTDSKSSLSSEANIPTFLVHIELIKKILKERKSLYGNTFVLLSDDLPKIKGLLFVHPLLYLWKQEEVIHTLEIQVEDNFDENIEAPVFSAKIVLSEDCSLDYNHSSVSEISYVSHKGLFHREVLKDIKLTGFEIRLCEYFYEKNIENIKVQKEDIMHYVYEDSVLDDSKRFKKIVNRLNQKLTRKLQLDILPIKIHGRFVSKNI